MAKEKVSKGIVHFCRNGTTPPQTVNRDINAALNIAIVLRRDSGERESYDTTNCRPFHDPSSPSLPIIDSQLPD